MSALQDIMNVDEDPKANKRDMGPTSPRAPIEYQTTTTCNTANTRYVSERDQVTRLDDTHHIRRSPLAQTPPSSIGQHASLIYSTEQRRQSNSSIDTMDPSYSQGRPRTSAGFLQSRASMSPMGMVSNMSGEASVKLTPITGRISRAKKGQRVHLCDQCGKSFTRAEHLRRHKLSHDQPQYACLFPGCERAFHRKDLLERHQQRHELEGDKASTSSKNHFGSPRISDGSLDGSVHMGMPGLGYNANSSTSNMTMTPMVSSSSIFHTTASPSTAPGAMSPPARNNADNYRASPGGNGYDNGYQLSSDSQSLPILHHAATSSTTSPSMNTPAFSVMDYTQPRSTPPYPLYLQTQGLSAVQTPALDGPPELVHHQEAWPSSASDSTYSTPSERSRGLWQGRRMENRGWQHNNFLSPFQSPPLGVDPASSTSPLFFPFTTSPPLDSASVFTPVFDMSMPNLTEDQTFLDPHRQQRFLSPHRSPTPPFQVSAQGAEVLVPPSNPISIDRAMNSMSCMKGLGLGFLMPSAVMHSSLPSGDAFKAIPEYLEIYWESCHSAIPIIHRGTFEGASEQSDVLRCAMAALATQYIGNKEHQKHGAQLHDYAWHQVKRSIYWDMPTLQTIVLCEYFGRFRGRKAATRPSSEFEKVYQRVMNSMESNSMPLSGTNQARWHAWTMNESRRRLLATCFVLDVHSSIYQEKSPTHDHDVSYGNVPSIPLTDSTRDLWEAQNAESWGVVAERPRNIMATCLSDLSLDILTEVTVESFSSFDKSIILAYEALQLRSSPTPVEAMPEALDLEPQTSRIASLFPNCPVANTYLALYYTPLQELLAVSGESWVFSQKLLQEATFTEYKKQLQYWSKTVGAAEAVVFACRALRGFTARSSTNQYQDLNSDKTDHGMTWAALGSPIRQENISDYWGMYICTLICWAFGHRATRMGASSSVFEMSPALSSSAHAILDEAAALTWIHAVASSRPEDAPMLRSKHDSMMVVRLTRKRLESGCVGGRSQLYVDAVHVLKRLEDESNGKWF